MTQTQQHCSTNDQLLTFLRGQLSAQEESELQLHLNDCVLCRERLENAAADANAWNEARQFFGSGALHASPNDSTSSHDEATQGSQRIRQVLDALGPTDDPESLGRIGGYEVTGVVGAGGMGVVLKAQDRSLDRIVAIKVMSPHLASSGSARKRFAREAKAAAAVLHPNVIAIHSVASEDASPYLVMPYVRGASLQKRIDSQGPLPLKDTLRIGAQIAAGLAAAHEQGLVHRDIKPANILLEEGVERVTITDFGLARAVDDASMTCSGVIVGTPQYMSPEQTRGEPINARSDLFSLGSVLYAMCAGRSPFRAETTYGVLHRIANDNPTPVCEVNSDVPVWLGHIIERLMAKRAEDRFESAAQVAALLEGCLAHVQQPAAMPLPESVAALTPKKTRRPPIGKFIAAAAGAITLFFAGILIVLELDKGTLTIESELDDVPIRIRQGENVLKQLMVTKSGKSVRVAAGTYQIEIAGEFPLVSVANGIVSMKRGETETVTITITQSTTANTKGAPMRSDLSAVSTRLLADAIRQFNELQKSDPVGSKQPLLTDDEVIAAVRAMSREIASINVTESNYKVLRDTIERGQIPNEWTIESSNQFKLSDGRVGERWTVQLSLRRGESSPQRYVFRSRYVKIEPATSASKLPMPEGSVSITEWLAKVNAPDPNIYAPLPDLPVTEQEIVAALTDLIDKDQSTEFAPQRKALQEIIETRSLPKEAEISVFRPQRLRGYVSRWSNREGFENEDWTLRFEYPYTQGEKQIVTAVHLGFRSINSRPVDHVTDDEIHWGPVAQDGLQFGVATEEVTLPDKSDLASTGAMAYKPHFYFRIPGKTDSTSLQLSDMYQHYEIDARTATGEQLPSKRRQGYYFISLMNFPDPLNSESRIYKRASPFVVGSYVQALFEDSLSLDPPDGQSFESFPSVAVNSPLNTPLRIRISIPHPLFSESTRLLSGEIRLPPLKLIQTNADTAESEKAKDEAAKAWLRRPVVGSTLDGMSFQLAGHDALMHCVMTNNSESLNRLLTMDKYDLDLSPGNGQWTLLQIALLHDCVETTSLLLRYGANPNFAGKGTPLPLELAKRSGQPKLVALVQEYLEFAVTHPNTKENEAKKQSQSLSAGTMESENSVDAERASNSVKRVIQYMSTVQQNDTETIKSIAKGIFNSDERTRDMSKLLSEYGIPGIHKTWFENRSAVVAVGPITSSDVNSNGRFLLFTLSLSDERWSIVDIDLEAKEFMLERIRNLSQRGTVSDATIKSLQGVWDFISVESDGVVTEYKTLTTQPLAARLTVEGDMWMVNAGTGSGGHRVKIDGNKLTFYGTTTSMPGLDSSKEISTIGYGRFRIDGDSLVYIVTPAVAGGDFTGQSELPIKFPETFETKGTRNNVFRLRKVGAGESAARDPNSSSKVPTSKSSPEFPPVKILVQDEEGKPLKGVQVSLFQSPTKEGGRILEISETSDEKGMAVSRNLPFGHYELSAKTAEGWYLPGNGSKINVEFEKGIDFTLVAPTPVPFGKLTIRDDVKTHSASVSELRFGILEEVNGPGFWVSGAPEPEADLGDYETFPTLTNGIEHVGVEIRYEIAKNISQPSLSASHLKTKWEWAPLDKANSSRRYLIANGQACGFVNGTVYEDKALHAQPRDDSKLFHLPSSKHRVGTSLITLREPTALPLELAIPAGEISIYVERFLGKPNAATLEALNRQMTGDQEELWLEANVQRNSAWIERLVDTTGWIPTILKPGYNEISGHLQMHKLMKSGENLEISLGRQKLNTKESNPLEARTIDDVTSVYNEQTRQLRTELFNPPIPNLTTDQMRMAMLDAAEQYRKQGKVEIASALKTSAETKRLADRLTFMGMSGTMSEGFRQITPTFHFEVAGHARFSIVLRKAELRYSLNGWSSTTWGDIHPPITGKWELIAVEERGESFTQDAFNDWRQKHASWTELTIDARSLTMAGENAMKFDFSVDYDAGALPQYTIRQDGNTKYSGVLMGNGFVDDTTLVLAVDINGTSKPKTFHTKDGKTTNLTYRRNGEADIQANAPLKTDQPVGSVDPNVEQSTDEILKIFQGHPKASDRTKKALEVAAAAARKDDKPLNSLYLLSALLRDSPTALHEVAKQQKIPLKDLIQRSDEAARVADRSFKIADDDGTATPQTTSAEQWKELAGTADETAKQWKHDYLGTEHLLMALIADGTLTKQFLSEQGIEAAAVRDMAIRIYFSPDRDATAVRPLPKQ